MQPQDWSLSRTEKLTSSDLSAHLFLSPSEPVEEKISEFLEVGIPLQGTKWVLDMRMVAVHLQLSTEWCHFDSQLHSREQLLGWPEDLYSGRKSTVDQNWSPVILKVFPWVVPCTKGL